MQEECKIDGWDQEDQKRWQYENVKNDGCFRAVVVMCFPRLGNKTERMSRSWSGSRSYRSHAIRIVDTSGRYCNITNDRMRLLQQEKQGDRRTKRCCYQTPPGFESVFCFSFFCLSFHYTKGSVTFFEWLYLVGINDWSVISAVARSILPTLVAKSMYELYSGRRNGVVGGCFRNSFQYLSASSVWLARTLATPRRNQRAASSESICSLLDCSNSFAC